MDIQAKRDELSNWIYNIGEEMLNKIDQLKKNTLSNEIVSYTTDGKGLTEEQYIAHIEKISEDIDSGAKTYTSEEVREYVLNKKK